MTKDQLEAILDVAVLIARHNTGKPSDGITTRVMELGKIARSLHKRYEAMCSYEWANTPRYERATGKLEKRAAQLGFALEVVVEHQRDPRGWPLIVTVGDTEVRLG